MLKKRELWYRIELSTFCVQLKLSSSDGKSYKTDCANTESAFRIIQSIPSAKAEPFKRWLAQVGRERIQEIENPELAQQRMRELYKQKGYPAARRRVLPYQHRSVINFPAGSGGPDHVRERRARRPWNAGTSEPPRGHRFPVRPAEAQY